LGANVRRVALLPFATFAVLVCLAGPARAQEAPSTAPTPAGPASQQIAGRLVSGTTPIEGVRVTAQAVDVPNGAGFKGEATSDADGRWAIAVPGPGVYRVALDRDTIPDRFALANPSRSQLPRFQMFPGATVRNAVFLFKGGTGGIAVPSRWEQLIRLFVSGIRVGLIIGVCSVGLSLIYGTTGLVNFAHGELVTLGALIAWFFNAGTNGPELALVFAAVIAVVLSGVFGSALELVLWRPMVRRRSGLVARMLVSIGLALFLRYWFEILFGAGTRSYQQYATQPGVDFGPLNLPVKSYIVMAISAITLVAVGVALQRTRLGTAIRAVADERDLAASSGIDVRRIIMVVWTAGAALAGLGGILLAVSQGVQYNMGFRLLLTMFAAVVLGGLGSAFGAMVGGLVVGVASEMSTYWFSPDFKFAVALVILILVLLVRPQGILGVRERVG
jgi:branched-chain amino acid transport system permease protein